MSEIQTSNPNIIPQFVEKTQETHLGKTYDVYNFDFNKLIPMPESLNIESGSRTDLSLAYKTTERLTIPVEQTNLSALISNVFCKDWASEVVSRVAAWVETASDEDKDNLYDMGATILHNMQAYGHKDWYSWRNANWQTKWNACDSNFDENDPCYISFSTAWSAPLPIFEKMCELFPDSEISFHCEYEEGFVVEYENVDGKLVQTNEYDLSYDDDEEEDEEYDEGTEIPDYDAE
jgi:hypothetical protein